MPLFTLFLLFLEALGTLTTQIHLREVFISLFAPH